MIEFIVHGQPVGKGRPKFSTFGGRAKAYTPPKTVEYENLVRMSFWEDNEEGYEKDVPLSAEITACFQVPKCTSKKNAQKMLSGEIRPTKKPDCDNIAKIILDALNSIAFYDDSQVVRVSVDKRYASDPCVKVTIKEIELCK